MPVEQHRHGQRRHLLVGDDAAGVGVDHPVDLRVGQRAAVALGADDVDGVERSAAILRRVTGRLGSCVAARRPAAARRSSPWTRLGVSTHQVRAAVLAAAAAGTARTASAAAVPVDAGERDQPAAAGGVQRRDQPALGAQASP